jgi:hypothetical protein
MSGFHVVNAERRQDSSGEPCESGGLEPRDGCCVQEDRSQEEGNSKGQSRRREPSLLHQQHDAGDERGDHRSDERQWAVVGPGSEGGRTGLRGSSQLPHVEGRRIMAGTSMKSVQSLASAVPASVT